VSPIKSVTLGVWVIVALGGVVGCAAVNEQSSITTTTTTTTTVVERRTIVVPPPAPARRPVQIVAKPATPQQILQPHTRFPLVAAAEPVNPTAAMEMWDGKGKCDGIASFYAGRFLGRRTANGEVYTGKTLTAAHRVLPFGTYVRVTNLQNGLDVIVRVNDRGPFVAGRVIDLSPAAARKLHMTKQGIAPVRLETVAAWMAGE